MRKIFFKVAGQSQADASSFADFVVTDNSQAEFIEVEFTETDTSTIDQLDLVACFSYGEDY